MNEKTITIHLIDDVSSYDAEVLEDELAIFLGNNHRGYIKDTITGNETAFPITEETSADIELNQKTFFVAYVYQPALFDECENLFGVFSSVEKLNEYVGKNLPECKERFLTGDDETIVYYSKDDPNQVYIYSQKIKLDFSDFTDIYII